MCEYALQACRLLDFLCVCVIRCMALGSFSGLRINYNQWTRVVLITLNYLLLGDLVHE